MKKLLIITRNFPPYAGTGAVMRILKFAKYLPEFGWQPFVIAEEKKSTEDSTLTSQLPSIVKTFFVKVKTPQDKKNEYKRLSREKNLSWADRFNFFLYRSLGYNLYSIYQNYFMAPDLGLFWAKEAYKSAVQMHTKEKFDAFLTSGPPFSAFRIGIELKNVLKIPWILDLRDMWVGNPIYQQLKKSVINWQNRRIEDRAIAKSDLAVLTTEPMQQKYTERYPKYKNKMVTITNGFDSEDYQEISLEKKFTDKLHFVYCGTIAGKQVPTQFFKGLLKAIEKNKEIKRQIEITFIGKFNYRDHFLFKKVSEMVSLKGILPHHSALHEMSDADVFLLLINPTGGETMMTGKIFEYLAFKKPIFAISIPSAATHLIKENNAGYIADWHNLENIAAVILEMFNDWKNGKINLTLNDTDLIHFKRKNLTKQLVQCLNKLSV